jgi:hypothetical protein
MRNPFTRVLLAGASLTLAAGLTWSAAQATTIPLGFISWDVSIPGNFGQFDIVNETGPNSAPPDFPISTEVQLNSLSLVVHFSDGSTTTFGSSYFTLNPDGESLDGSPIAIGGVSPRPTSAILTGDLTPTTITVNGTPTTVNSAFDTATIVPSTPPTLSDGDLAIINADTSAGPPPPAMPEPNMTWTLLVGSFMVLIFARRLRRRDGLKRHLSAARFGGAVSAFFAIAALLFPAASFAAAATVKQNNTSNPGSGVAGISFVTITGSGFPSGGINPANVTIKLAPTCTVGASGPVAGEADAPATSVKTVLGSTDRVNFELPSTLAAGTYLAQVVDTTDGFAGGNCSIVMVTTTTKTLNACVPTSSLGVVAGTNVVAYVPNGWWGGSTKGITAVPIEGGGSNTSISTANIVNSCAGNPATGQVVCTANNTDAYLISGSPPALTNTLTSGLTGFASFSGGSCSNCGVAINALTNTAVIAGGAPSSLGGGDGVQVLNLSNNTFQTPFKMTQAVSEDISIDPGRNLILSPNESGQYPLLALNSSTGAVTGEFDRSFATGGGEPDSAAEDCSTGIALASDEFTSDVFAADLSQATLTAGSPGSWTSPFTLFTLTGTTAFSAGISGISVAQGSSHQAIVSGEFGGNTFGVLQLQSASGTGGSAPNLPDYVSGLMPNTPDGLAFTAGCDPHTLTAYTSPNTGKAIGLYAGWTSGCGIPKWIGVIDLSAALTATRTAGTHMISPAVNLLTSGIVTYIKVQ